MQAWSKKISNIHYRPNMFLCAGGIWGFPEVALSKTIEDFRFLAEIGCIGIIIDTAWGHWATQGPQYYLMTQLAWNPKQDGQALMADYYCRGFGPAADNIAAYWKLMEAARDAVVESPNYHFGSRNRFKIANLMPLAYTDKVFKQAYKLLARAAAKTADGPEIYRQRVAFVQAGLDFTRMMVENIPLMARARESRGKDFKAVKQVAANWAEIERINTEVSPFALNYELILRWMQGRIYMGPVGTHFGPPTKEMLKAAEESERNPELKVETSKKRPDRTTPSEFKMVPAEEAGWKLAFSDDFARNELGQNWEVVDGTWTLKDGCLTGSGTLLLARGFPGFQRLEFEVASDIKSIAVLAGGKAGKIFASEKTTEIGPADVSDMSSFIHARAGPKVRPTRTGYFFQFGGQMNSLNQLSRSDGPLCVDEKPKIRITPNKLHLIIAENDQGRLRLIVDGKLVFEYLEDKSLAGGEGQDRIGFYLYTPARVRNVKVYTKPLQDDFI